MNGETMGKIDNSKTDEKPNLVVELTTTNGLTDAAMMMLNDMSFDNLKDFNALVCLISVIHEKVSLCNDTAQELDG